MIIRAAHSDYADHFETVWGTKSLDAVKNVGGSYERIVHSIAAYKRSIEVSPFNPKFDLFWDNALAAGKDITRITAAGIPGGMGDGGMGGGMSGNPDRNFSRWEHYRGLGLGDAELQSLAIFNDRAGCAVCSYFYARISWLPAFHRFSPSQYWYPEKPGKSILYYAGEMES